MNNSRELVSNDMGGHIQTWHRYLDNGVLSVTSVRIEAPNVNNRWHGATGLAVTLASRGEGVSKPNETAQPWIVCQGGLYPARWVSANTVAPRTAAHQLHYRVTQKSSSTDTYQVIMSQLTELLVELDRANPGVIE